MKKAIYVVKHEYEVDGGFGDAVGVDDVVAVFDNEEAAKEFVKRYEKPETVYDKPYSELTYGTLTITTCDVFTSVSEAPEPDFEYFDNSAKWYREHNSGE